MQNPVEEIKNRLDIIEVISEHVQLRQVGGNYRALCPFHTEKAPSFFVSPERQIWHCFGSCNEGGDIFKFIMKIENVDFPEALRILAKRAGVQLAKDDYQAMSQRTKVLDLVKLAANFYHLVLLNSSLAQKAREYLSGRGVEQETVIDWQLGFAPDNWDELVKFLIKKKVKLGDAELAGLVVRSNNKNSGSGYYDRFRNRIMFPINDLYGNPVGFTSRIVPWAENDQTAKYVNTPETPVYNKSRILYGLDKAKVSIKKEQSIIVVEGNMDVITCHQAGSKNVVASSGTALTLEQIKILKRYANNLLLAFDVDPAGSNATQRGIDVALKEDVNVKVITIPEGKDPDECIKENREKWFEAVTKAQSIMNYYIDFALKDRDPSQLEDKKAITKILLPIISKIGDSVEQDYWLKFLADKIDSPEYLLRDKIKAIFKDKAPTISDEVRTNKPLKEHVAAERFLALLFKKPEIVKGYLLNLPIEVFRTNNLQILVKKIKECYNLSSQDNISSYLESNLQDQEIKNYYFYLGLLADKDYGHILSNKKLSSEEAKKELINEIKKLFFILYSGYLKQKRDLLTKELKEAEKNKQPDRVKNLLIQISKINKEIHQL